ncbi:hypothetical protein [Clostridium sp.]|uniref:hypothetical protein n=1 Tax=Clostridium sp. TaxID=1506 RepID=UPI002FC5ABB6
MRIRKIVFISVILLVMFIITFFIYTRFCLDRYEMKDNGNTVIINNSIYIRSNSIDISDEEGLGKTIGIAIEGKRIITDYIWPYWVMEYKNDKEHNRIFIRGLMGSGGVYEKNPK